MIFPTIFLLRESRHSEKIYAKKRYTLIPLPWRAPKSGIPTLHSFLTSSQLASSLAGSSSTALSSRGRSASCSASRDATSFLHLPTRIKRVVSTTLFRVLYVAIATFSAHRCYGFPLSPRIGIMMCKQVSPRHVWQALSHGRKKKRGRTRLFVHKAPGGQQVTNAIDSLGE